MFQWNREVVISRYLVISFSVWGQVQVSHQELSYLVHQSADQFGLKYVPQGDPVQETQESLECGLDQRGILGVFLQKKMHLTCVGYSTCQFHIIFRIPEPLLTMTNWQSWNIWENSLHMLKERHSECYDRVGILLPLLPFAIPSVFQGHRRTA